MFQEIRKEIYSSVINMCFIQMSATKGIKLVGEAAIAAIYKEYKQFMDLEVLGVINPDKLTAE